MGLFWSRGVEATSTEDLVQGAGTSAEQALQDVVPASMAIGSGRIIGAREVADVVLFPASARSADTSGSESVLDGGQVETT